VAASIRIMTVTAPSAVTEKRFAFGQNWRGFLGVLDQGRIAEAEKSLQEMLGTMSLQGRSFLDVGSGSGLFSLAAARLGASRIRSFDFDPESVACTAELKRRYRPEMEDWIIERGNVLDQSYLASLGGFDIVYSWGVLHHTGKLWRALGAVAPLVAPGGTLFVAVYNDRGWVSKAWRVVKRIYNSGPLGGLLVIGVFIPVFAAKGLVVDVLTFRNPAERYRQYRQQRGMSILYDWLDWLGGLPYEVAKPDAIRRFFGERGFSLTKLKQPVHRNGNNEFVFLRHD
jgi:2-polyprenyl-3-methyl-5-hydroxy-6-metoxy-1,4-benzoquinol methylase